MDRIGQFSGQSWPLLVLRLYSRQYGHSRRTLRSYKLCTINSPRKINCACPHLHVFGGLDPVAECPEPEKPPYYEKLEPHCEQDGVREERQNSGLETEQFRAS